MLYRHNEISKAFYIMQHNFYKERIRFISARIATKNEMKKHEK